MSTLAEKATTAMERIFYNYSMKNIPIPAINNYKKALIEKVESVIKRMRWKAYFFLQDDNKPKSKDTSPHRYVGLKSRKNPPHVPLLKSFEDDLLSMVENIETKRVNSEFQNRMKTDMNNMKSSNRIFVSADKTRNIYKMDAAAYTKLMNDNVTSKHKLAQDNLKESINADLQRIATQLNIQDRISPMAENRAFITLKDHKENFATNPSCRLINPAKTEMGKVSKSILDSINKKIRENTK